MDKELVLAHLVRMTQMPIVSAILCKLLRIIRTSLLPVRVAAGRTTTYRHILHLTIL